jgi:hypothetical protein
MQGTSLALCDRRCRLTLAQLCLPEHRSTHTNAAPACGHTTGRASCTRPAAHTGRAWPNSAKDHTSRDPIALGCSLLQAVGNSDACRCLQTKMAVLLLVPRPHAQPSCWFAMMCHYQAQVTHARVPSAKAGTALRVMIVSRLLLATAPGDTVVMVGSLCFS